MEKSSHFTGKNKLKSHPQRLGTCKSSTRKPFRADESHHCHLFAPQTMAQGEARESHTWLFFEYSFLIILLLPHQIGERRCQISMGSWLSGIGGNKRRCLFVTTTSSCSAAPPIVGRASIREMLPNSKTI